MMTVIRVKRFEHGFALLTVTPLCQIPSADNPTFYALYQGSTFAFASPSLDLTIENLMNLNFLFNNALHVGKDERAQLEAEIEPEEVKFRQIQKDFDFYQSAVLRHQDQIKTALRRHRQLHHGESSCS